MSLNSSSENITISLYSSLMGPPQAAQRLTLSEMESVQAKIGLHLFLFRLEEEEGENHLSYDRVVNSFCYPVSDLLPCSPSLEQTVTSMLAAFNEMLPERSRSYCKQTIVHLISQKAELASLELYPSGRLTVTIDIGVLMRNSLYSSRLVHAMEEAMLWCDEDYNIAGHDEEEDKGFDMELEKMVEEGWPSGLRKDEEDECCSICLEEFVMNLEDKTLIVTTPCSHPFHFHCLLSWLQRASVCPLCRFQLLVD